MDVGGFIEETNRTTAPDVLFARFHGAMAEFGLTRSLFAGGSTDPHFRERYGIRMETPIIVNNYPDHWTRHYLEKGYISVDPVFARVRRQWAPLMWDQVVADNLGKHERRMMDEARESGLCNGLSLPMHGPEGDTFIISLASDHRGCIGLRRHLPHIRLIAAQFFMSLMDLWQARSERPSPPQLTKRERECLQWAALGKSAWETGVILRISEPTVRFHLSNAFAKLGAQNRINAIVRAVRWGMIDC